MSKRKPLEIDCGFHNRIGLLSRMQQWNVDDSYDLKATSVYIQLDILVLLQSYCIVNLTYWQYMCVIW